jgi:hypothetical protein
MHINKLKMKLQRLSNLNLNSHYIADQFSNY